MPQAVDTTNSHMRSSNGKRVQCKCFKSCFLAILIICCQYTPHHISPPLTRTQAAFDTCDYMDMQYGKYSSSLRWWPWFPSHAISFIICRKAYPPCRVVYLKNRGRSSPLTPCSCYTGMMNMERKSK